MATWIAATTRGLPRDCHPPRRPRSASCHSSCGASCCWTATRTATCRCARALCSLNRRSYRALMAQQASAGAAQPLTSSMPAQGMHPVCSCALATGIAGHQHLVPSTLHCKMLIRWRFAHCLVQCTAGGAHRDGEAAAAAAGGRAGVAQRGGQVRRQVCGPDALLRVGECSLLTLVLASAQ